MTEATGYMTFDSALAGFKPVNLHALESCNGYREAAINDVLFNCDHALRIMEHLRPLDKNDLIDWEYGRAEILAARKWWEKQKESTRGPAGYNSLFALRYKQLRVTVKLALDSVDPDLGLGCLKAL